ncbi:hypothetical protein [Streptomyces longwoodensis]|uniref:hypothetical protein n=1 Tax=Streptomyces longwoodensis TaxID=68231 RepID=UPI00224FABAE|nr:hypothetical protein [Streptomyces longwoodensis]MCX5000933.1 hypothetical protein [Streptomyces longwoodensis]
MQHTAATLQAMAHFITRYGLHTGDQFAAPGPAAPMDICAVAYITAERCAPPPEFFTDEVTSLAIIESSAGAMAAIRAISEVLDSTVCETEIVPGTWVPDYIEHVSNWAATASPITPKRPPTIDEVIGRILRAANTLATQTTPHAA